jgi:Beta-lactamase enzyme family
MKLRVWVHERSAQKPVRLEPGDLGDDEQLMQVWGESRRRAYERHLAARSERRRRRAQLASAALLAVGLVAVALGLALPELDRDPASVSGTLGSDRGIVLAAEGSKPVNQVSAERQPPAHPARAVRKTPIVPVPGALKDAWTYAQARGGAVSIAVVDTRGRLRGEAERRLYSAASVVKSMLLAAEVRRLQRADLPLDSQTESLLRAMITFSSNEAADSIYSRVGDAGLFEIARAAGMNRFTVAGHWGNAQITAADMARMFFKLDRLFAGPHREFALGLLGSIVAEQSWGIPAGAPERWAVRFKGGWVITERGQLAHQAAELRDGRQKVSIAVLTDYQPSMSYVAETVLGVTQRLLAHAEPRPRRSAAAQSRRRPALARRSGSERSIGILTVPAWPVGESSDSGRAGDNAS